jgi:hypothetical protein
MNKLNYSQIEQDTYTWINICRTNPKGIIPELKSLLKRYTGLYYHPPSSESTLTSEVKKSL